MTRPAETLMSSPVIEAAPSPTRKVTSSATSSGLTRRPRGEPATASLRTSSRGTPRFSASWSITCWNLGLSMAPGVTRFTLIPYAPASSASVRVKPIKAVLLAA